MCFNHLNVFEITLLKLLAHAQKSFEKSDGHLIVHMDYALD